MENKSYESITFEVESELSKPQKLLYYKEIDNILSSNFRRAKDNSNKLDIYKDFFFF